MSEVNTQVSFPGLHIFLQVENRIETGYSVLQRVTKGCWGEWIIVASWCMRQVGPTLPPDDEVSCISTINTTVFCICVTVQSHLTQLPLLVHRHLICHCSSSSRHVIWANPWIKTSIHVFFKTVALVLMCSCLYLYRCQFPHTAVIDFPLNNPELGTKICPHPPTRFKDTGCIMQSSTSHSSNIRWQIHHNWLTIHCCFRAMWDLNQSKHRLQTQYGTLLCLVNM